MNGKSASKIRILISIMKNYKKIKYARISLYEKPYGMLVRAEGLRENSKKIYMTKKNFIEKIKATNAIDGTCFLYILKDDYELKISE